MVWFTRKPTYELILMHTKETSFSLTKRLSYFLFVEAAPTSRKGVCQRHVNDIAGFLRGAHVTIKAHHEGDDVEEEKVVLEKVSKSSGARYGSTRKRPDQWNHPVQWVWFTRKLTYELILMQTNETSFGLTKREVHWIVCSSHHYSRGTGHCYELMFMHVGVVCMQHAAK
ncbi:uncharacterized protein LOC134189438 isoform X2 [Corticium candelabrum]|uniref:uncharacterized protein LOC134189438 isoform X2 n=1 Tax=Corticium candelabrum TaxID=121492 RepID=UPI002E266506|nr:uncharacterized protein LOC134189438 isoform X2 [Corticium candelabrum]